MAGAKLDVWEYPKNSGIKLREIINQNGDQSFDGSILVTVPAKLTGNKRLRKQFKSKKLAEDWAVNQFSGYKEDGKQFLSLTEQERRDCVTAIVRLREKDLNILDVVEFAIERLKPKGEAKSINDVIAELQSHKEMKLANGKLRPHSYNDYVTRSRRLSDHFDGRLIHEIHSGQIKSWLLEMDLSPRSIKNYLSIASEVFGYAVKRRYIVHSPTNELTDIDKDEVLGHIEIKEPEILTIKEAKALLGLALETNERLQLLPAIVLGMFCGIRTEEIKRLNWEDIRLEDENPFITIGSKIAKKRRIRNVSIPENAMKWLSLCSEKSGEVVRNNHYNDFNKRFQLLIRNAGFGKNENGKWKSTWKVNSMRHSFGSYHFALYGDSNRTAEQLGHKSNDQVLFDHYRALTSKQEAEEYFSIVP
jgi:integrase